MDEKATTCISKWLIGREISEHADEEFLKPRPYRFFCATRSCYSFSKKEKKLLTLGVVRVILRKLI